MLAKLSKSSVWILCACFLLGLISVVAYACYIQNVSYLEECYSEKVQWRWMSKLGLALHIIMMLALCMVLFTHLVPELNKTQG